MNKKKILIVIIVILLLAVIAAVGFYIYKIHFNSTTISSIDNSFSITVPNRVRHKIKESNDENYSLEFYSVKDEMFFYSTVIEKKSEINLEEVVKTEISNLNTNLTGVNLTSDIQKTNIQDYNCYKYGYTYTDEDYGNDLYAEILWIETDSKIYILDLEVITKNMEKYKTIFEQIQNSFIEN